MFTVIEIPFASSNSGLACPTVPQEIQRGENFLKLLCKPRVAELDATTFVEEHMPKVEVVMDGVWITDVTRG